MGRKKKTLSKDYFMAYWKTRLTNIVCSMFKWENLPKEINSASLEKQIMLGGFSIFFKDKNLDTFFSLPGALTGVDVYGYPSRAKPVAMGGIGDRAIVNFDEYILNQEAVVIYANKTRTTAIEFIEEYADALSDIDAAIKMNLLAMKHPLMLKTSETTKESFETIMHQYEDNYYILIADKSMQLDSGIEALNFNVSSMEILNLQKQKETKLNEFFNMFGISGSVEKRERIISGEMNAMMEQMNINKDVWLSERQRAVDKINEIYNLNLSVDYALPTYDTIIKEEELDNDIKN